MPIPVIGVSIARKENSSGDPIQSVIQAYIQALTEAGACPILIPVGLPEASLDALLPHLDGVLFSGGGDVHPERYGSEPHLLVREIDEERDQTEVDLFREVLLREIPFLGICRGLQLINVAMGGTLYEDLKDQRGDSIDHDYDSGYRRDYLAHSVKVEGKSLISEAFKEESMQVNSLHHQGIWRLASDLRATGHAPDGLIEAVEIPGYPFGLAVQWHPEWLTEHSSMRALFSLFVAAANGRS